MNPISSGFSLFVKIQVYRSLLYKGQVANVDQLNINLLKGVDTVKPVLSGHSKIEEKKVLKPCGS